MRFYKIFTVGSGLLVLLLGFGFGATAFAQRAIENPSFEENNPNGNPGFSVFPASSVRGWESTTGFIELWDDGFLGVSAADGVVLAEMNAHSAGNIYQTLCMTNGETVGYDFYHRARSSTRLESLTFEITDTDGNLIQVLASSGVRLADGWVHVTGSVPYTGPTGFQRIQFNTTDAGSSGNLLDNINIRLAPYVRFAEAASGDGEGDNDNIPKVLVSGQVPVGGMSVDVAVTGGTAREGSDYILHSNTINIPAGLYDGVTEGSFFAIDIEIIDDPFIEGSESIGFRLSNAVNGTIADANCEAVIYETEYEVAPGTNDYIPTSVPPTGFNPSPPASGPGSLSQPFLHLARAHSVSQSGRYYFEIDGSVFLADIDASEGGGWVLILQYVHQGGTNPSLGVISAGVDLPITSTNPIGSDDSADSQRWGHAGNAAVSQFTGDFQTRFYGESADHNRLIHFYTGLGNSYLRTGSGSFSGVAADYTALVGHSSYTNLPAATGAHYSGRGNYALTEIPFYKNGTYHWSIKGQNQRWEVDDDYRSYYGGPIPYGVDTIHRAWLRSSEAPHIDIASSPDTDPTGNAQAYANNGVPALYQSVDAGDVAVFTVSVEPYVLQNTAVYFRSGSSLIGNTLGPLPEGWSVVFKDAAGTEISQTAPFSEFGADGFGATQDITVEISIPAGGSLATLANHMAVIDDAGTSFVDANGDGDGDFGIFIRAITDSQWGQGDDIFLAIDVNDLFGARLSGGGDYTFKPGSFEMMDHVLENRGNAPEAFTLSALANGQDGTTSVWVDTTGDGAFDSDLGSLTAGDMVYVKDSDNQPITTQISDTNTIVLDPLVVLYFGVRVTAPTNATDGHSYSVVTTALYDDGNKTAASDSTITLANSNVRLFRSVAVDTDCSGLTTASLNPETSFTPARTKVEPGWCAIYQITATNIGVTPVYAVEIIGASDYYAPAQAETMRYCLGDAGLGMLANCTFLPLTDLGGDDEGEFSADTLHLMLGGGSDPSSSGRLSAGESVTMRYAVRVN